MTQLPASIWNEIAKSEYISTFGKLVFKLSDEKIVKLIDKVANIMGLEGKWSHKQIISYLEVIPYWMESDGIYEYFLSQGDRETIRKLPLGSLEDVLYMMEQEHRLNQEDLLGLKMLLDDKITKSKLLHIWSEAYITIADDEELISKANWEKLFYQAKIDNNFNDWNKLVKTNHLEQYKQLCQLAEERLPLSEMATGAKDEFGREEKDINYKILFCIIENMLQFDTMINQSLVLTALNSPITSLRNITLQVIANWTCMTNDMKMYIVSSFMDVDFVKYTTHLDLYRDDIHKKKICD